MYVGITCIHAYMYMYRNLFDNICPTYQAFIVVEALPKFFAGIFYTLQPRLAVRVHLIYFFIYLYLCPICKFQISKNTKKISPIR